MKRRISLSILAFSMAAMAAPEFTKPQIDELLLQVASAKQMPLMGGRAIPQIYLTLGKITQDPDCPKENGLADFYQCLWRNLGQGPAPATEIEIINKLLEPLRAELESMKDALEATVKANADNAVVADLETYHNQLCEHGKTRLAEIRRSGVIRGLNAGQRYLLQSYIATTLSSDPEASRQAFCITNRDAILLAAELQL